MNPSIRDPRSSPNPGLSETSTPPTSPQVLIVDDEADVVQALKLRLETAGYRALTAADGAEALTMLRRSRVDLILTDLMMPNLDGLELARRVGQDPRCPSVPVLLFSSNDDPSIRKLALEFGARDYLSKSLGTREIVSRVQEILTAPKPFAALAKDRQHSGGSAEVDLGSQLQAISNLSAPAACSPFTNESAPAPAGGAWIGDDLLKLAASLTPHVHAPQSGARDD